MLVFLYETFFICFIDSDLPKVDKDPSRKSSSWLSLGSWFSDSDSEDRESDSSEDTSEESSSER
jgi:hypothetical protein